MRVIAHTPPRRPPPRGTGGEGSFRIGRSICSKRRCRPLEERKPLFLFLLCSCLRARVRVRVAIP